MCIGMWVSRCAYVGVLVCVDWCVCWCVRCVCVLVYVCCGVSCALVSVGVCVAIMNFFNKGVIGKYRQRQLQHNHAYICM